MEMFVLLYLKIYMKAQEHARFMYVFSPFSGSFAPPLTCFCAFMLTVYMKAQKHFHVFSSFSASFYPPLGSFPAKKSWEVEPGNEATPHYGKGSIAYTSFTIVM